jgi:hypothetical protein
VAPRVPLSPHRALRVAYQVVPMYMNSTALPTLACQGEDGCMVSLPPGAMDAADV